MDSDEEDMVTVLLLFATHQMFKKKKRKVWVRPYLLNRRDISEDILSELRIEDRFGFKNFLRMTEEDFGCLLEKISPIIIKQNTHLREAVPVSMRLGTTLRFLATGDSYTSLMYLVRISKQLISTIIPEVCDAILMVLKEDHMKMPRTAEEWKTKADDFLDRWNFNHAIGAIDRKHVVIQAPANTGSLHYNYKSSFSVVLMAVVDSDYMFTYVNVGCQGRISDGGVFKNTSFYRSLMENTLNLPHPVPLPTRIYSTPYVLIADSAFPLTKNIMKPYAGTYDKHSTERIYNNRLSRARNVVENSFGIASSVFRVLRKPLCVNVDTTIAVTMACAVLHNYLRRNKTSRNLYSPAGTFDQENTDTGTIIPGSWRNDGERSNLLPLYISNVRNATIDAKEIRNEFASYFSSDAGRLPWYNINQQ